MSSRLPLHAFPGFTEDLAALPSQELRTMVLELLVEISAGTLAGRPLDNRVATGDLSDCYKLYFDTETSGKPRFRLLYRVVNGKITVVQAVATGERKNLAAYHTAAHRLGRIQT